MAKALRWTTCDMDGTCDPFVGRSKASTSKRYVDLCV